MARQLPPCLRRSFRLRPLAAAAAFAVISLGAAMQPASAFEINTGSPGRVLRLDTTVRYNLAVRTQAQDQAILGNPNYDDGNRNFDKGKLVANRLDLLSELDLVIDKRFGLRVSATAWADGAYASLSNTNNATANTLVNGSTPTAGVLSPYSSRYAKGVSGEVLDAFAFASTELGTLPVSVRVGKHTVIWGESLLGSGAIHGVSYGQYSLDLWKALATPGIEAKELFRPRNSVTLQVQPTPELTLSAQGFLDWESVRYPESGSYLSVSDALQWGGDSLIVGPGQRVVRGGPGTPNKTGDFGLAARWSPDALDGTAGLYLRRTADIQPQLAVMPAAAAVPTAACLPAGAPPAGAYLGAPANGQVLCYINPAAASLAQITQLGQVGRYNLYYGRDIDILGLSLSKNIAGISVGAELNYRRNMPLQSTPVSVLPGPLAAATAGAVAVAAVNGDAPGARGSTLHGVLSLIGSLPKTAAFDSAAWAAEMVWNRWLNVTQNAAAFKGGDAYRANPANVDGVTKDFIGLAINFTPTWFQVLPSVDLSMPLAWSGGLVGNSAVTSGGNKDAGSYSIGVVADVQSKYNFALRYVGFYGNYSTLANGAMNVPNGVPATLSDRGHVALTFKTNF